MASEQKYYEQRVETICGTIRDKCLSLENDLDELEKVVTAHNPVQGRLTFWASFGGLIGWLKRNNDTKKPRPSEWTGC